MHDQHPSAVTPRRRRRGAKVLAGSVALTIGTFGSLAAISALPAYALQTSTFTIGAPSGPVNSVAATPTATTASTATGYAVSFVSTSALASTAPDSITVASSVPLVAAPTSVSVIDDSASTCFQTGAPASATTSGFTVNIGSACSIAAGNKVEVDFTATSPSGTSAYDFTVTTDLNATSAASNSIANNALPPTVSPTSGATGGNATYTISGVPIAGLAGSSTTTTVALQSNQVSGTGTVTWYTGGAGGYTATYTPSGGTAAADTVSAASATGNSVTLTLGTAVGDGGTLSLTAEGSNPATAATDSFTVTPTGGTAKTTTNDTVFGTSVSGVIVTPSPAVAGASSTYTVSFKATDGITAGGSVTLTENGNSSMTSFTGTASALIADASQSWGHVVVTPTSHVSGSIVLPVPDAVAAGDTVTLTIPSVTNPSAGTITDFTVVTSQDPVGATASAYSIGVSGAAGITVSASPTTASAVSTYTFSNLYASSAFAAATAGDVITLTAPAGTLLPSANSYYVLTDVTTPSGSGTASATGFSFLSGQSCAAASPSAGSTCESVSFEVPNAINSGDQLTLTVSDVVNPPTGTYAFAVGGLVSGPNAVAPFPQANASYPNGAIVNFSGTFYLFAGGHAFGIASQTVLGKLQSVDHATVLKAAAGATVPTAAARAGTLITTNAVNSNATIYVVGTDGQLHGFATVAQFTSDGYDPALTVTVPSLGGMTAGATAGAEGTAATALAYAADGAIVDSSGTYYLIDGGRAFGISTPANLAIVRKGDKATALTGTVGNSLTAATIASGVLLTVNGIVYVAYVGNLFPFKAYTQLTADGYSGTAAVTAPSLGGLSVVSGYTGS